ncbi:TRAP transporter large permease [Fodinicurvata sp. EGI_FJ10296]|uniref:TRAP transporter large permease n=1 Tax=Fodinicurvata sp. EGI_FJ10296 TaxID=3231908 RepID=UPI0034520DEF
MLAAIGADTLLLLTFVVLMIIGTPIAVSLGMAGVVGIWAGLPPAMLGTVGTNVYSGIAKYPLIAIPLFVLTGLAFERSGVAQRLVDFASACVGPRRGGLAVVAIMTCLIMGGMSGSGPADAAAVATVMIPSMMRAGYPKAFSASVIAAASSTAILIPPSIALIIYAVQVPGADIRALFAGGVVPGLLCGAAVLVPAILLSRKYDFGAKEGLDAANSPSIRTAFVRALPGLLAPVIILGGLRTGLFTPTEAAAVAASYGLLVGTVIYRNLGFGDVYRLLAEAGAMTAVIMLIVSLAGIFAWAGSTLGAFSRTAEWLLTLSDQEMVILALIMVFLLIAGMLLDGISIYLITLPLLMPVVAVFDWNIVWFGILMAMNIAIGQFTPPIAVNLMVTTRIAGIPIEWTFGWIAWMVLSMGTALVLVAVFPELALWLPRYLGFVV